MASTSVQGITSSSSSPPPLYMYDVFLSFRGKDTRKNFTSHLYSNLKQRGIDVYMDDRELERGKTIEPALWKAIEESRFSVIIFSRDYASSPWCLDELVKIVQCMKEMGHTVLPVFYDVDPSEVAEQKGQYEKAFVEHEQNFKENLEKVRNWKDCLSTVANLSGWDIRNSGRGAPATQQQQIQLHLHQQRIQHLQLVKMWQGWLQKREHMSEQQCEEHLELQEQLLEWRWQQQQLERPRRRRQQLGRRQQWQLELQRRQQRRQLQLLERYWQLEQPHQQLLLEQRQQQHEQQPHQQLLLE